MFQILRQGTIVALVILATSCSTAHKTGSVKGSSADLVVPPSLDLPISTGIMDIPVLNRGATNKAGECQLPLTLPSRGMKIVHAGNERWISTDIPADMLWDHIEEFWDKRDFDLLLSSSQLGIMETYWKQESDDRFSTAVKNKFRLRLENPEKGETEIFITHYGLQATDDQDNWKQRERDRDIEAEYLQRLALVLGYSIEPTTQKLIQNNNYKITQGVLIIPENFNRSWRRVGLALDRIGAVVTDRDRSKGSYFISQISAPSTSSSESWFDSLFQGDDDKIDVNVAVRVKDLGEISEVTISGDLKEEAKKGLLETIREQL